MELTNGQWNQLIDDYWSYIGTLPKKRLHNTDACTMMLSIDNLDVKYTSGGRVLPINSHNEYEGYTNVL